jgi:putative N-acetylmannosamine-6-phosphate epimerase
VPPHRYAYYLTPKGFIEKSHLVASYFVYSFDFFRRARSSCKETVLSVAAAGYRRIALIGASDLTEIATIVATEVDIEIVAIVDKNSTGSRFLNIPVVTDVAKLTSVDAVVITSLVDSQAAFDAAIKHFGAARVFVPLVLANMIDTKDLSEPKSKAK